MGMEESNTDIMEHGRAAAAASPHSGQANDVSWKRNAVVAAAITTDADLPLVIAVQPLLAQFAHPEVRADLINFKFEHHYNPMILNKIDDLR